jgi:FLYWCH zinc finger domain
VSRRNGKKLLCVNGIRFFRNRHRGTKQYWKCSHYYKNKCPTLVILDENEPKIKMLHPHTHELPTTQVVYDPDEYKFMTFVE